MNITIESNTLNRSTGYEWGLPSPKPESDADATELLRINKVSDKKASTVPFTHQRTVRPGCGKRFSDGVCGTILFFKEGWPSMLCPECQEKEDQAAAERKARYVQSSMFARQEARKRLKEKVKRMAMARSERNTAKKEGQYRLAINVDGHEIFFRTCKEAADHLGIHPNTITQWLSGKTTPVYPIRRVSGQDLRQETNPERSKFEGRGVFILQNGIETHYRSVRSAAISYGIDPASVANWLKLGGNHKRQLQARFAGQEYQKLSDPIKGVRKPLPMKVTNGNHVLIYDSTKSAAKALKMSRHTIFNLISTGRQSADGYRFERPEN